MIDGPLRWYRSEIPLSLRQIAQEIVSLAEVKIFGTVGLSRR